ncbi:ankycorbin-like [Dendronephthya gigantea]|uniref:ankycorbin-like n=1 Tax=Dendronephthya gigantea TaxID=151771 RepID=UPI00106A5920|nr:ankycorbin-like [Dendronephthya gigantea]XP_028418677.1 ankycorbin-like [Dendronephthya gigantea]XP_028418756.1 ankycorbin-like [Dendronephthya gigantea]XP_028418763.1 ankycorbin-like [Dendronephthya gigantea]XP_028418773.1 ankycorbin-like [Dendronephthya gigantea]
MKKFKDKLGKGSSSHVALMEWTKYDDKILDYIVHSEENKLRLALLRKGVTPLKKKSDGKTMLDVACEHGHVECLEALLERCTDVVPVSKAGGSALHTAAKSGSADSIVKLLQYKVRVGSIDADKMTALHHSASKGHVDCVRILIQNGAKLNSRDKDGRTPLLIAIQAARESIVQILVENGARVNVTDSAHKTPLMYASLIGLKDAVCTLLQHGANPLLRDSNGHQAEDFARISGYGEIVRIISDTPVLPQWDYAEEYIDDEDSQDGSVIGSNDGSDVASMLSHPDSEHRFGSVYSSDRRSSSHSVSTFISSSSHPGRLEANVCKLDQELERENNRLNTQLPTMEMSHSNKNKVNRLKEDINYNKITVGQSDDVEKVQQENFQREINALKAENEQLKNELIDINVDDSIPTIPITVYQELKESTEEELSTLNASFSNLKKENDNLKRQILELKHQTRDEAQMKSEQKICALEEQVLRLQNQLMEADTEHSKTINVYRLHLLNALQGVISKDVKKALELILKIRNDEQFC